MPPRDENPTVGEMLFELLDLLTGLGVMLLPVIILAVPCLILLRRRRVRLPRTEQAPRSASARAAYPVFRLSSGAGRPRPSGRTARPRRTRS